MKRTTTTALISAGATFVVLVLLIAVAWVGQKALLSGVGRSELFEECNTDATLSGFQGYCVTVSRLPATLVESERTYLEIAPVHDGAPLSHRFVTAYPFFAGDAGDDLDIDFARADRQIVVGDPETGSSITYTIDQYGTTR